jgi:DNA repair protein RadD
MSAELRGYQLEVIEKCRENIAAGVRKQIMVAPTGSGKTIIAGSVIKGAVAKGRRALLLGHTREIIKQTSDKLSAEGIDHGIVQAGFPTRDASVQVATVQTLWARAMRSNRMELPAADLLIVDEAQHATASTWRKIIEAYPQAVLIGLTATPCRGDGRGLGGIFDVIVECPQVPELIKQGYLVGTRVYAPAQPDLTGIRTRAGDYVEEQLAQRMDQDELVGDIVQHWHKHGSRLCPWPAEGQCMFARDCVVADPVVVERVSNSLLTGKFTGNSHHFAPGSDFFLKIDEQIQSLAAKFPIKENSEFF